MKGIVLEKYGSIDNLIYKEIKKPTAGDSDILIRIRYAAINPYDWKIVEGVEVNPKISLPVIPGSEFSGVVEEVGKDISNIKCGDRVCGKRSSYGSCFADYMLAKESEISLVPNSVSLTSAAALPVGGLLAWKIIFEVCQLKKGQKILIHGGAGAIGSMTIQLAKTVGAIVIATGSLSNKNYILELGANEYIDYRNQRFEEIVKDVDVVLDTVGGDTQIRSFDVLKDGGKLISLIQPPSASLCATKNIDGRQIFGGPDTTHLKDLIKMLYNGSIKISIEKIFPLSQAADAMLLVKQGHRQGKILLSTE